MKKNLGVVLSIIGGSFGLLGLIGGGPLLMLMLMAVYYFGVGFIISEYTELNGECYNLIDMLSWLPNLLKSEN